MSTDQAKIVYPTYGVHNPPEYSPCACQDCLYQRGPGEPSDPLYPVYWSAKWTMYRVFGKYGNHLPPYDGRPPAPLQEYVDYQISHGATYYDITWRGPNGEEGAMMEHYEEWSLPIFPIDNHFTSSFISLGNLAYFITYNKDRPKGMPPICLFSDLNYPPRRDFIKHLPYSASDSQQLGGQIQGYSFWTSPDPTKPPIQTGASPDRTAEGAMLFGYAFKSIWERDAAQKSAPPYRHPHSFYFSGFPLNPPNAPIVSQHYTEFAMIKPDPAATWDLVAKMAGGKEICPCKLFGAQAAQMSRTVKTHGWAGKALPG
jgi:hypothetical protein